MLPASGQVKRRIVLVEDDPDTSETLKDLLELSGHEVEVAEDGLRGVELVLASRPEAALIDIGLPVLDGFHVARRIRAAEGEAGKTSKTADGDHRVFLIALTGYGTDRDLLKAKEAGFDTCVVKPPDMASLEALLSRLRP